MSIYLTLIRHDWYTLWRSPMWAKNLFSLLFNLLGFGILLISVPFMGYYFGDMLFQMRPDITSPTMAVGGYLPQYFLGTTIFLALSLQLQSDIPSIYLLVPRMRRKTVWYILFKSLFHGFQRLFLLFFIPFAWHYILPEYGYLKTILLIIGYVEIHVITTLLVIFLKNMSVKNWIISLSAIALLVALVLVNRLGWLNSELVGHYIMTKLLTLNLVFHATVLLSLIVLMDKNYKLIWLQFTAENASPQKTQSEGLLTEIATHKLPISWLYLFRLIGYDNLKRPSFILALLTYCIFMSLLVFVPSIFANTLNMLMYFQMLASALVVNIFPSFFSLSSTYMDGLVARRTNIAQLLILHYRMVLGIYFFLFLLWLPLLYVNTDKVGLICALSLFHGGFTACVYLLNAYFFAGRSELGSRKPNGGGGKMMGGSLLALFGVWLLTVFMYSVLGTVLGSTVALLTLGSIGIIFIATHAIWLKEVVTNFEKNKYKKLESYRAK